MHYMLQKNFENWWFRIYLKRLQSICLQLHEYSKKTDRCISAMEKEI